MTLRGSNLLVVRDITDITHPKTIGTLGPTPAPQGISPAIEGYAGQFVSATELTYVGGPTDPYYGLPTSVFRQPISGSPTTVVVKGTKAVIVVSWSWDGKVVAYLTATDSGMELHQLSSGHDRVLASLPPLGVGGCEVAPCPEPFQNPADKWDFRLAFSPDGAFISVVQNGINSVFRVWTSDGKALTSSDSPGETMSVWSGKSLYFRSSKGVEVWRDGVLSTFLPGVAWIRPKASPSGGQIVYEARDSHGSAHVYLVDTATGKIRDLRTARVDPVFLTSRYIWYQDEPLCVATGKCEPTFPGIGTGKTYIYDLQDGTETGSIITSVADVWPHAA